MDFIYHITTIDAWLKQQDYQTFINPSLDSEGFIHCSTKNQIKNVLGRYFCDHEKLIILEISTSKIKPKVKYEPAHNDHFPHIYGPINKDSIEKVYQIETKNFTIDMLETKKALH